MVTSYHIQEFRCRIAPQAFAGEYISYLTFPYHSAFDTFLEQIKIIRGKKLRRNDYPPFESLNRLLVALTPSLVHPFIRYFQGEEGSEEKIILRRMMVLRNSPHPSLKQLERVIRVWVRRWVEYRFKNEIETIDGAEAYRQLLTQLSQPKTDWQEVEAGTLISDIKNPLTYRGVPSLLATRLAGEKSKILGEQVEWQLTQEPGSNRLTLVSQPVYSSHYYEWKDKTVTGFFIYHIDFGVQSVPGDPEPFIHIHISCRRYVEEPLKKLLFPRKSTVMVSTQTPRLEDWPVEPTLVPIRIRGIKKRVWWEDRVTDLLDDLRARPLKDIQDIAGAPKAYWEADEKTGDRYFILHSEGVRPNHPLETSFSPKELYAVWQAALLLCDGILLPVDPIERDSRTQRLEKTTSMLPVWEFAKRSRVTTFVDSRKKWLSLDEEYINSMALEAVSRALPDKRLTVFLLYRTKQTHDELIKLLKSCQLWQIPEITFTSVRIEDYLTTPIEHGDMDPDLLVQAGLSKEEREALEDKWEAVVEVGRRKKIKEWRSFLTTLRPAKGAVVALIELPSESIERDDLNPKRAIREACIRERIGSQMLASFTDGASADQSRAKNALADLLVRQCGVLYGNVVDMYQIAGIPTEMATRLTVVGLCRVRSSIYGLDYSIAVRILPSGRIEMLLPGEGERWQSYYEGCLALGEVFRTAPPSKDTKHKKELKLSDDIMMRFVQRACLKIEGPTVVLVNAQDFRSVWTQLQNPYLVLNELSFTSLSQTLQPNLIPNLWVIRLREAGNLKETPQYVRVLEEKIPVGEDVHYAEGLYDLGHSGEFPIYHSIGRGPTSGKQSRSDLKIEEGGATAFKHQHVLEMIPFFSHDSSISLQLARMTYFFRFTQFWEIGTTISPLPIHLGYDAISDYLCLLPSTEEEEDF